MASILDICNLALARLGDDASMTSIDPPDGSAQADHCARFYAIARDAMLESHPWSFATRRAQLALLTAETDAWAYAYALPTNCLKVWAVQHHEATADYGVMETDSDYGISTAGPYTPQPFAVEVLATGAKAILTNQEDAAARYTVKVTDPTLFSALFTDSLVWKLASMVAGPLLKGDAGIAMAQKCEQMAEITRQRAIAADSGQRAGKPSHRVPWMSAR